MCEDNVPINTSALDTVSNTTVTDMYANSLKVSPIPNSRITWIDIPKDKVEPTKIKRFRI